MSQPAMSQHLMSQPVMPQPVVPQPGVPHPALSGIGPRLVALLPGLLLCGGVTLAAVLLERIEAQMFGRAWLEALVLAILIGTVVRTVWSPGPRWGAGIAFSGKTLLEIAVVLLGASLSAHTLAAMGPSRLLGIMLVVAVAILASYGIGRLLGLRHRMAVLVACGNSICGNSAIAAVAPVIGADGEDIAASIAFTAVLGVIVVLGLPFAAPLLHMSETQFGTLAGLTVYAVPQVLAATAPVGLLAVQMGTLVKLVRVLMLGPVVMVLALLAPFMAEAAPAPHATGLRPPHSAPKLYQLVPWFIIGFLALALLRSAGLLPASVLAPASFAANWLTVLAMAALGLATNLRTVARAGLRVTAAVTLSLMLLGGASFGLIRLLGIS